MTTPVPQPIKIAVVTGTRAEFGLLHSTITAIQNHPALTHQRIVTCTHLLPEITSLDEIKSQFKIDATVQMQTPVDTPSRAADVQALSRGIANLGTTFNQLQPDAVLILGDRIEAFAAATAASIGGFLTAHIHGGDRAEGIADEAIRHAITKLAHLHFPATNQSANRIKLLGEDPNHIHNVGSPAVDHLSKINPADDQTLLNLNLDPTQNFAILLHHPSGLTDQHESTAISNILHALDENQSLNQYLTCAPNHDPGRTTIINAIQDHVPKTNLINNLPRPQWLALLKRASIIIGNSSAGLIEAAVLDLPCLNLGDRQAGREQADNVINLSADQISPPQISAAIAQTLNLKPPFNHPYGNGTTAQQITTILANLPNTKPTLRKRNQY